MNIALIGFRGTGKTTIAKLLARKLEKKLVSTEDEILKKTKLDIEKFVKKHDWDKFYEIESEIMERLSDFDECVFDTCYSIAMRNENIINLKKNSLVVSLTADIKTILKRLKTSKERFFVQNNIEKVNSLLQEYEQRYRKAADYTIDTSRLSSEEACDLIAHYSQIELQ